MSTNMELIEAKTLASNTATITFSSIPQTYTDIVLRYSTRSTVADGSAPSQNQAIRFNSDTGANYKLILLAGSTPSTAESAITTTGTSIFWNYATSPNATANTFSNGEIYIPNYTSSNYKSASIDGVTENNSTTSNVNLTAALWNNTDAINTITITDTNSGSFVTNSTFYLYGIKNS